VQTLSVSVLANCHNHSELMSLYKFSNAFNGSESPHCTTDVKIVTHTHIILYPRGDLKLISTQNPIFPNP
jgi:hypothetical protein